MSEALGQGGGQDGEGGAAEGSLPLHVAQHQTSGHSVRHRNYEVNAKN